MTDLNVFEEEDDNREVKFINESDSEDDVDYLNVEGDKSICQEDGKSYKVGEFWGRPGICEMRTCNQGGVVSVMTCPRFIYDKKKVESGQCAVREANINRDYPMCCEVIYCDLTEEDRTFIRGFNDEK